MGTGPDRPRDREELLVRMAASRDETLALFDRLDEATRTGPQDAAGWAAKDHFFHLVAWRRIQLARLRGEPEYAALGLPDEATYRRLSDSPDLRDLNAWIADSGRVRLSQDVRELFVATDDALRAEIIKRDFADLAIESHEGTRGDSLLATTIGNTYEHDPDHRAYIVRIVGEG